MNAFFLEVLVFLLMLGGCFFTVVGMFTFWHVVRPQKYPADKRNRINKIRLYWFAMTREDLFADEFEWLNRDDLENIRYEPKIPFGLLRYDDQMSQDENNKIAAHITKIIVPSEHDKHQLILASKYLHDLRDIDTHFFQINTLAHLYLRPDLVEVQNGSAV